MRRRRAAAFNECSRNDVITRQAFCLLGRQVGDGEREGTQAVETDDPKLIVDGGENTRHIAFLVLAGAKTKPIIERNHTARKSRAVMLAERFDRFDHQDQPKRWRCRFKASTRRLDGSGLRPIAARKRHDQSRISASIPKSARVMELDPTKISLSKDECTPSQLIDDLCLGVLTLYFATPA
jgi:hypothetical protein